MLCRQSSREAALGGGLIAQSRALNPPGPANPATVASDQASVIT